MLLDRTKTVRELAIEMPNATRIFEKAKIDYCCGGNRPLDEACTQAGVDIEELVRQLSEDEPTSSLAVEAEDFKAGSLAELANHIVNKHHVFTRDECLRLTGLLEKVCGVHETNHPELREIQTNFGSLRAELEPHMLKEEGILFPYITRLETAVHEDTPIPFAPFGSISNPIATMMREHDAAGDILKTIRQLSGNFALPEDACFSYRTLYSALEELEADLHQHIHLENNILFVRAVEIENSVLQTVTV
jgi:regulator of cell morphogenesis and NO signaling